MAAIDGGSSINDISILAQTIADGSTQVAEASPDSRDVASVSAENALSIRKVFEITQEVNRMVQQIQQLIARFKLN